jgi:pimeloyl-ACP methyl ester carboxylesterase
MTTHTIAGGGGLELAVHEYGNSGGQPIVLLHGFGQSHLVWAKQFRSDLAQDFRFVCPDLRGHGMSEKPTTPASYTRDAVWADDLRAVITGLSLQRPMVAGWSYGGFVVNDYVARYGQDTLGGINYVAGAVMLGVEKAMNTFGTAFLEAVPGLASTNLEDNIRALRTFLRAMFVKQPSQDDFEELLAMNMVVPPGVRLALVSRTIDRDEVMKSLTIPVLVTAGGQDAIVLDAHTMHLLACLPRAQKSVYPGVGHGPPVEEPERFNRELAAFARAALA